MDKIFYSIINPIVKLILRSSLHRLMSHNTLLLEFKGRKSGKTFTTPVSYHETDHALRCFTDKSNKWWHNLRDGNELRLTFRGRECIGKPTVLADAGHVVQAALTEFLIATPREASHSGVAIGPDGQPESADIIKASERLVLILIKLRD